MKKIFISVVLVTFCFIFSGYRKPEVYVINAQHNAIIHNNLGISALREGNYAFAISEFDLAIRLNPNTQATSVYYRNLGNAYAKMHYFANAKICLEKSQTIYNLNFQTYQLLAYTYKKLGLAKNKINYYKKSRNPLDMVMLGLLYIESGQKARGITKLDQFCVSQPSLFITNEVKTYIRNIPRSKKRNR